jgi:hypothetical protein
LRFWLAHKLVERFRTRYRVVEAGAFEGRAKSAWEEAAAAPHE